MTQQLELSLQDLQKVIEGSPEEWTEETLDQIVMSLRAQRANFNAQKANPKAKAEKPTVDINVDDLIAGLQL